MTLTAGDSGGPLVDEAGYQVGVTSWGQGKLKVKEGCYA